MTAQQRLLPVQQSDQRLLGLLRLRYVRMVLLLSVVDNLDFAANRLTARETLLMLASQGAYQAPHFKQ